MTLKLFPSLAICGLLSGGLLQPAWGEGPADLEALARKAREAASEEAPIAPNTVEPPVAEPAPDPTAPQPTKKAPADVATRTAKLGLISGLSKDVTAVMTFTNGKKIWEEIQESKLGQKLLDAAEENDLDLTAPNSPGATLAALLGEEFLFAVGRGTPQQTKNLLSLNQLNQKQQIAMLVQFWTMAQDDEDMELGGGPFNSFGEVLRENPDFLVNLITSAEMPPILLAAKITDAERRDEIAATLQMGAGMALQMGAEQMPFLKEIKSEVGGVAFSGLQVEGGGLIKMLEEENIAEQMLSGLLDPASQQDLLDSLQKKNLVLLSGSSKDAVYLFLGSRPEDIPLVVNAAESLATSDSFSFVDDYLEEDWVNVLWVDETLLNASSSANAIFATYVEGIRLGLKSGSNGLETTQLQKQFDQLLLAEKAYLATLQNQTLGTVSFIRADGLHSESFGGVLDTNYDWTSPHQMGLSPSKSFLTFQAMVNPESSEAQMDYIETAFLSAYEGLAVLASLEDQAFGGADFWEGWRAFDQKMKDDALALWKALRVSEQGLGSEMIFEVDLAGSFPTVPGLPEGVVEKGPAPRLSWVAPVTDRSKLAESWVQSEQAIRKLLTTAGELAGENIPMQKPMSSESNGLKTWFLPFPMLTDDFVPSVTLNDEVMVMSTSKERAVTLAQGTQGKPSGKGGQTMVINFEPMREFLEDWLKLVQGDPEKILAESDLLDAFRNNEEMIEATIDSLSEFDSWTSHYRVEEGILRGSSHFKTK